MCVQACSCAHVHTRRAEVHVGWLLILSTLHFVLEAGSCTGLKLTILAILVDQEPLEPSCFCPPGTHRVTDACCHAQLFCDAGDLHSGTHHPRSPGSPCALPHLSVPSSCGSPLYLWTSSFSEEGPARARAKKTETKHTVTCGERRQHCGEGTPSTGSALAARSVSSRLPSKATSLPTQPLTGSRLCPDTLPYHSIAVTSIHHGLEKWLSG